MQWTLLRFETVYPDLSLCAHPAYQSGSSACRPIGKRRCCLLAFFTPSLHDWTIAAGPQTHTYRPAVREEAFGAGAASTSAIASSISSAILGRPHLTERGRLGRIVLCTPVLVPAAPTAPVPEA